MNFDFSPILKQIIHNSSFQRIVITINEHNYNSNIVFGTAFSNHINNQVKRDSSCFSFKFSCYIKNESTYDVLGLIFDGNFEGENINFVIDDLFNVGVAMESNTLITWYRSFYPLYIQNFNENVIYYRQVGNIDEFIIFIVNNFRDIGLQKVIEACLKIGIDFAEILSYELGDMKNEFIISLIERDLQFSLLINQIDTEKLTYEEDIRLICLHNTSIAHDYHPNNEFVHFFLDKFNEKLLSDLRSINNENKELSHQIIDINSKLQQSLTESQKIKNDFENLKKENQKLKEELENAKKQIENPPPRVFSQSELELISIHKAASKNNVEIVKLLINNGVSVNLTNENGETPLHLAIISNCFEVAEFLINNGADVNKVSKLGDSPLQCAKGNAKMVDLLIRNGAKDEKNVTNYDDCNPFVYQSFDFQDYKEEIEQPEENHPQTIGWLGRIFGLPKLQNKKQNNTNNNLVEIEKSDEAKSYFDTENERNDFNDLKEKEKYNETTNFYESKTEEKNSDFFTDRNDVFNDKFQTSKYDNIYNYENMDDRTDDDKNEIEKTKDFYFYTDPKDDDDDQDATKYYIDDEEEDDDKYI